VTQLKKRMLEEFQSRNYAQSTVRSYIYSIEDFARYFGKSPDQLGPEQIRAYQVHLFRDRKLSAGTVEGRGAALRFLYVKTLRRPYLKEDIPFPKRSRRLPLVLSAEEVALLIDSAENLMHRATMMTLYATGIRRAELCRLQVADIDSARMVIHIRHGKNDRDRDVPLTPKLVETLGEYWRWMKPKTWLFPGMVNGWQQTCRLQIRWRGLRFIRRRSVQASKNALARTLCATASSRTCWTPARISEPFRFCSVTPSFRTRRCIFIYRGVTCRP